MRTQRLGLDGPEVSCLCLGTMTWGTQTPEAEAHAQIELAGAHGVNFMDTAEMYPVNPVRRETVGHTETIIGNWIARGGRRQDWVIATKIAGAGSVARETGAVIDGTTIRKALEGSLGRLRTDHVDLYQFHWPNRGSYAFRQNWTYDPRSQDRNAILDNMVDCLQTLKALRQEGKIGHWGLSNESAWGMAQWLRLADAGAGPRPVTVQNEYSLLARLYDTDLAELGHNEGVTLLAFSPIAAGYLSGKYAGGAVPAGSRKSLNPTMGGRASSRVDAAVAAYMGVAAAAGLDPVRMAVAWTLGRPFPCLPIIGATTLAQLENILPAADLVLAPDVLAALADTHRAHPMPY